MSRARITCWGFCVAVLLAHAPARAQPSSDRQQASVHFDRGLELIEEQAYAEAAVELERAFVLSGDDAVLYNLGMAYAAAGRSVEANDTLSRYLASKRESLPQAELELIEDELKRQRSRIVFLRVLVEPADAAITVDSRPLGNGPLPDPVALMIGDHRLELSRAGYETATRMVSIAGEQHVQLQISLPKIKTSPAANPGLVAHAQPGVRGSDDGGRTQRMLAYVLGGAGVAAGITALAAYLVSDDRYNDWQSEKLALETLKSRAAREPPDDDTEREIMARSDANNELLKSVWQLDTVSAALAIGGGALLVTGTVLFLTAGSSDNPSDNTAEASATRVRLTATGAVLSGSF